MSLSVSSVASFVAAPVCTLCVFFLGRWLNRNDGQKIGVDKFLVVQTGILTASAILIALGGTFLPERSSWIKWALAGSLFAAIVWTAAVLFTMITQQAAADIDQKAKLWIPGVTNAAWIALVLLAFCCILVKAWTPEGIEPVRAPGAQTAIVRDRVELGSTQEQAIYGWGRPAIRTDTELAYRTPSGWIVMCFKDRESQAKSISEITEVNEDAVENYCH